MKTPILVALVIAILHSCLDAAPGDLDGTFGNAGKVTLSSNGQNSISRAMALQPDGKIVVGGQVYDGSQYNFAVVRVTQAGAPDSVFGTNGFAIVPVGYPTSATAVAPQPDGKIVLAGSATVSGWRKFALARVNADGSIDSNFGNNGSIVTVIGAAADVLNSVVLQSDGKILAGGWTTTGSNRDFVVLRYTTAGVLDTSFGINGIAKTDIGPGYADTGESLAIQPDGKILLGGTSNDLVSGPRFALCRYLETGTLDTAFGSGGMVTTFITSSPGFSGATGNSVALQSNGGILLAGDRSDPDHIYFCVARYSAAGALDGDFGTNGIVTTAFTNGSDYGRSIVSLPGGQFAVGGYSAGNSIQRDFNLARYKANGALDTTFGNGGKVSTDLGGEDECYGIAVQGDGKLVLVGHTSSGPVQRIALTRYNGTSETLSNLEKWRYLWFGTTTSLGNAQDELDFDHDRFVNLAEFALDLDPNAFSLSPFQITKTGNSLEFTYARSKGAIADGFVFTVEWSDTLAAGSWSSGGVVPSITSENARLEYVSAILSAGSEGRRFVRLRITSN